MVKEVITFRLRLGPDTDVFHAGPDFMVLWRRLEASAESMSVHLFKRREG